MDEYELLLNEKNIYWVGPRGSDISNIKHLFKGAITISGVDEDDGFYSRTLENSLKTRLNLNADKNSQLFGQFYRTELFKVISRDERAVFLWYGEIPERAPTAITGHSPFNNPRRMTNMLSNKLKMRAVLSSEIMVLPCISLFGFDCEYDNLRKVFTGHQKFVIQELMGSGGYGTHIVTEESNGLTLSSKDIFLASVYLRNVISLNVHVLIYEENDIVFPPSIQIIEESGAHLFYTGGDFLAAASLDKKIKNKLLRDSKIICRKLRCLGYRGVAGIDYLLKGDDLLFVEINPRFQASTLALNQFLLEKKIKVIQELHIQSFFGPPPDLDFFEFTPIWSLYTPVSGNNKKIVILTDSELHFTTPDPRVSCFNTENFPIKILSDNAANLKDFETGTSPWRMLIRKQILGNNYYNEFKLIPSMQATTKIETKSLSTSVRTEIQRLAHLKFELFAYGTRISHEALLSIFQNRKNLTIRDGIGGGLEIVMYDDIYVNVPIKEGFAFLSPFCIEWDTDNKFWLSKHGQFITKIKISPQPSFVGKKTRLNTNMEHVGQLFTDRLGTAAFCGCKNTGSQTCKFCEIGSSGKPITKIKLEDIADIITYCLKNTDVNMKHLILSGGSHDDSGWRYYYDVIKTVKSLTEIKLYIMIEPPNGNKKLKELHKLGVNEIGLNIEVFDRTIAKNLMPNKGAIPLERYSSALEYCVSLWGKNGSVRSILIVGLEPPESTIEGVKFLANLGVMPILSPFRPIPGTELEKHLPPEPKLMYKVWEEAQAICESYDLTLGPLCICCQNNTISLPINEYYYRY